MSLSLKQQRGSKVVRKHKMFASAATSEALPPLTKVPPMPDWLPNASAKEEWKKLAPILVQQKMLTEMNVSLLALFCSMTGNLIHDVKTNPKNCLTNTVMLNQYRLFCNEFGLTPSSMLRAQLSSGRAALEPLEENPFESNKPEARKARKAA